MDMKKILDRIDARRAELNLSDRQISLRAGQSQDLVRNWRRALAAGKDSGANAGSLAAVANVLGIRFDDIAPHLTTGQSTKAGVGSGSFRQIGVYDIEVGAGDGTAVVVSQEQPMFEIGFPADMLRELTNAKNSELAVLKVRGDSMFPTLSNGDMVLVDTTKRNLNYDGIFVLRYDDVLRVKRLDLNLATSKMIVKSDNAAYEAFEVPAEDLNVIGRVIWMGKKA